MFISETAIASFKAVSCRYVKYHLFVDLFCYIKKLYKPHPGPNASEIISHQLSIVLSYLYYVAPVLYIELVWSVHSLYFSSFVHGYGYLVLPPPQDLISTINCFKTKYCSKYRISFTIVCIQDFFWNYRMNQVTGGARRQIEEATSWFGRSCASSTPHVRMVRPC